MLVVKELRREKGLYLIEYFILKNKVTKGFIKNISGL